MRVGGVGWRRKGLCVPRVEEGMTSANDVDELWVKHQRLFMTNITLFNITDCS
jgi:hypothetical protein